MLGGAALITFPALLWIGLSPISAAIVNTVALIPVSFSAAYYERKLLPPFDGAMAKLVGAMLVGSCIGAFLLVWTPLDVFQVLIPLLLALATLLFARGAQVARWIEGTAKAAGGGSGPQWGNTAVALVPCAMYGAYFGAGAAVLTLAVLSVGARGDYRIANAIKNFITGLSITMSTVVYQLNGAIEWRPVLLMMLGGLLGARIGTLISRVVPKEAMRTAIIGMGLTLTVAYAWRYWF